MITMALMLIIPILLAVGFVIFVMWVAGIAQRTGIKAAQKPRRESGKVAYQPGSTVLMRMGGDTWVHTTVKKIEHDEVTVLDSNGYTWLLKQENKGKFWYYVEEDK